MQNTESKSNIREAKIDLYAKSGAGRSYQVENESPELRMRHEFEYRVLSSRARGRVLDAGAGYGRISIPLSATHKVVALDTSEDMLEVLRAHRSVQGNPETVVGDVEHLPFADGSFDTLVSMRVLVHLPAYEHIIAEFLRVLSAGGILMFDIASLHRYRFRNFFRGIVGKPALPRGANVEGGLIKFSNALSPQEIEAVVARHGGRLERVYPFSLSRSIFFDNRLITRPRLNLMLSFPPFYFLFKWLERGLVIVLPAAWFPYYIAIVRKLP